MHMLQKIILLLLAGILLTVSVLSAELEPPQRAYSYSAAQPVQLADPSEFPAVSVRYQPTQMEMEDPETFLIRVNCRTNTVTIYKKDSFGGYTDAIMVMLCSVGKATPRGTYKISVKYEWRPLFGNTYGQYSVRIIGNILFHSVPYTCASKDALKYEEYNKLGTTASMGCIRLSCADAFWIYTNCASGTTVELYDDDDPGPLGKPELTPIDETNPNRGWDPTDPDEENPWRKSEPDNPAEKVSLPEILGIH